MSIPLKLFLVLGGNGDVRTEFQLRILNVEIPFFFILILTFIDKLYLQAIRHYFASTKIGLDADVSENRLPFESPSINNFSAIDISQGLDRELPSLSPYFLLYRLIAESLFLISDNVFIAVIFTALFLLLQLF